MKLPSYYILYSTLMLLLSSACSNNIPDSVTEEIDSQDIVLKLGSNLRKYSATNTIVLPENAHIGVFAAPYNQPSTTCESQCVNIDFAADASGSLTSANPLKLHEGDDYSIYAYVPYKQEASGNPESILFIHGEDVLGCPDVPFIIATDDNNCSTSLNFAHLTAQIQFIVKVSDESVSGSLNALSVLRATGFPSKARLNLTTGVLSTTGEVSEQADVKTAATVNEQGKYELISSPVCFFITPDAEQTIHLRITHEGNIYTGEITAIFQPGESYSYTVWLSGQQQKLTTSMAITDWINQYESIDIF